MLSFLATLSALVGITIIYWIVIRPKLLTYPRFQGMINQADGFWSSLLVKLRLWWDAVIGGTMIALPEVFQIVSNIDWGSMDLEFLQPNPIMKGSFQILGVTMILVKGVVNHATDKMADKDDK